MPPALRLDAITKRFGPLVANDGISLDLARGEVLALLGENGAGKSTLVSILFGHYVADAGRIEVEGKTLPPGRPAAALEAGIGMVHQHFMLADNLSVLDNVLLGTEPLMRWRSNRQAARQRLVECAERFGLPVDPDARVGQLSVGERQRVEILKALVRDARILILDEPTAVLTPQEAESLFGTLLKLVSQGLAIVFISHKLDEVLRVSHRVAVLRAGRLVATADARQTSKAELAAWMVGREVPVAHKHAAAAGIGAPEATPASAAPSRPVVCALQGVSIGTPDAAGKVANAAAGSRRNQLDEVSLEVHTGEIVAVAGVSGNGQAALAALLSGERSPDRGTLLVGGRSLPPGPRAFGAAGVARVPEDRQSVGAIGDLTLWENLVIERYHQAPFARWGWLDRGQAQRWAQRVIEAFDVRGATQGAHTVARRLSGGNLQKLILGRALTSPFTSPFTSPHTTSASEPSGEAPPPVLVVANQPTWGLDVGAVADVHQRLLDVAARGTGVVVISEDLDEVFALADRIAVIHAGRLTPARPTWQWSRTSIGLAMAGAAPSHGPDPATPAKAHHAAV